MSQSHNPKGFYASLVGPFLGYYCEIPNAQSSMDARYMCNQDRHMQRLWCSIYTLKHVHEMIDTYGGQIIEIHELDAHHWSERENYNEEE